MGRNKGVFTKEDGPDLVLPLKTYAMQLCEECIDGIGEECHTPGCVLWLHSVDLPIDRGLLTEVEYDYECKTYKEKQVLKTVDSDIMDAGWRS